MFMGVEWDSNGMNPQKPSVWDPPNGEVQNEVDDHKKIVDDVQSKT